MTATALPSGVSFEQFLELLDQDAYKNAELIDGQVVVSTPNRMHQHILAVLLRLIGNWIAEAPGRGEVTFNPPVRITHDRAHLPDLAWYSATQVATLGDRDRYDTSPDVAVEVLSPSTRSLDLARKRADYARVGVNELWLIDPAGPAVVVLRRRGDEFVVVADLAKPDLLTSPRMPGLAIAVGDLIRR